MNFGAGDVAIILSLLVGWASSVVLAFVNPCLVNFLSVSAGCKWAHMLLWAVYVGAPFIILGTDLAQSAAWTIALVAVPILTISHFGALLLTRRALRLQKSTAELAHLTNR